MSHKRFLDRLAFLLNNPIRRFLDPPQRLLSKLNISHEDVVVDFGCGPGFFTIEVARMARKAIGVDVSSRMLERAAAEAKRNGAAIETIESDGKEIRLPNESVDLILLAHVFHEVTDRPRVLGEFLRILRPSGRLAIVEKTSGNSILSRLGPPIMNVDDVVKEMTQAGFRFAETIADGRDSIVIAKKGD
jgi:ubiquinone/menaquinone biosynthesis C-methylase UbiE